MPRDFLQLIELLELAEDARAYKDAGEQWAVEAVMILRNTIAEEEAEHRRQAARARLPEAAPI